MNTNSVQHHWGGSDSDMPAYRELVRRASLAPSRRWIATYFDLARKVVEVGGFSASDPRLSLTMPELRQKSPSIKVNVNNRWVLVNYTGDKGYRLGVIYGSEYEYEPYLWQHVEHQSRFDPLLVEPGMMSPTPYFLWIRTDRHAMLPREMEPGWLNAVLAEAHRAKGSVYRDHHQPVVYRAIVDLAFRREVLDEAFAKSN